MGSILAGWTPGNAMDMSHSLGASCEQIHRRGNSWYVKLEGVATASEEEDQTPT